MWHIPPLSILSLNPQAEIKFFTFEDWITNRKNNGNAEGADYYFYSNSTFKIRNWFHGENQNMKNKRQPLTNGLASCGVYARGKFCGNLKVCRPSELLRSPARTPSRQPLGASSQRIINR